MNNSFVKTLGIIAGVVILNIAAAYFFFRLDLTEEKRYSISDATQNLIQNLDEEVYVKVYLDGDELPAGFVRLKNAVKETLDEFKVYGGTKVDYVFIDPNAETDPKKREEEYKKLIDKGLQPTNIIDTKNGRKVETLVFPYAVISSGKNEIATLLLKGNEAQNATEKLNQSYENVEYELATSIRKLTLKERKKIGLLTDFTKLKPISFAGLITSLQEYYDLFIINSKESPSFIGLDALILPKPDYPIDDSTKFKIDQYIMNGGHAMFFFDALKIDSIGLDGTYAQPLKLNIEDLLFKYGVRVNENIIKDGISCATIPMVVGNMGDRPNIQLMPYRYFPLINNFGNSLITKNLDLVYTKFTASMDTVKANGIVKIPLLMTTPYTKVLNAPAYVTYNEARTETEANDYNEGVKTIAYLLEGKFTSLYKNRILPSDPRSKYFKEQSPETKIIVCSDGDLIVNDIDRKTQNPLPLGFDKYSKHTFGNKDFVMHAIDYLVDENGVISARGKEITLRPLDKVKARDERTKWQVLNLILPIGLVVGFGAIRQWWRRRKYGV